MKVDIEREEKEKGMFGKKTEYKSTATIELSPEELEALLKSGQDSELFIWKHPDHLDGERLAWWFGDFLKQLKKSGVATWSVSTVNVADLATSEQDLKENLQAMKTVIEAQQGMGQSESFEL